MKHRITRHPFNRIAGGQKGFTLIEMLVALLIVSVALMSMIGVWTFGLSTTRSTDDYQIAASLSHMAMEQAKRDGYYFATSHTSYYTGSTAEIDGSPTQLSDSRFRVDTTIYTGTDPVRPDLELKAVVVTVTRLRDDKQLATCQTYLSAGGI